MLFARYGEARHWGNPVEVDIFVWIRLCGIKNTRILNLKITIATSRKVQTIFEVVEITVTFRLILKYIQCKKYIM